MYMHSIWNHLKNIETFMLFLFHVLIFYPHTYNMAPKCTCSHVHASMLTNATLMSAHDCASADAKV